MLAEQRAERILQELAQRRAATVTDLCQVTGASEATIRRDLNALARQGKLSKVHGGAVLLGGEFHGEELDMETKRGLFTQEKDRAARYAAGLIGDDDVVFLDAGTTVLRIAGHLRASRALFLTNSIECACRLMGYTVYIILELCDNINGLSGGKKLPLRGWRDASQPLCFLTDFAA